MRLSPLTLFFGALLCATPAAHCLAHHAGDFEDLRTRIERILIEANVPGVALVIANRNGIVWSDQFGIADHASGQAVTPHTVFRIGSVTKFFTAAALVQLARKDGFSLDDPVARHLPAGLLFNPWEAEQPVTVAHLLEHTSGLRDWSKAEFGHNTPVSLEQGLRFSAPFRAVQWKPGMHTVYSNANYGLAGLVLERVAGTSYENLLRETLFAPLGMTTATSLFDKTRNLASGYDRDGTTEIPYWHMIQRPAAAINMRAQDMGAMISMLLNNGRHGGQSILTAAEIERMETPRTSLAARNGIRYGYGLAVYTQYRDGFRFMEHGGDGDGYRARLGYCRQLGAGYFVVINSDNAPALARMRLAIEYELTRRHNPPAPPPVAGFDETLLQRYTGRYALAAWRFDWLPPERGSQRRLEIRLGQDGNVYSVDANGEERMLLPVSTNTFRRDDHGEATSGFFEQDGALYFEADESWIRIDAPGSSAMAPKIDVADDPLTMKKRLPGKKGAPGSPSNR